MKKGTKRRAALRTSPMLVLGLALATGLLVDCYRLLSSESPRLYAAMAEQGQTASLGKDTQSRIERFCGDCHAVPLPDSFPRYAWHSEVGKGYAAYARSGRQDLDPPPMDLTLAYYLSRAPERLTFPEPREADQELKVSFQVETIDSKERDLRKPGVADLRWLRLQADGAPVLVVSDMRRGSIHALSLDDKQGKPQLLARLDHPSHVEACDLDCDSAIDLLVTDLGSYVARDHDRGRVVWLRRREGLVPYEPIVLASGLGRVADVRPGDFDGDGDLDLVVAEFGMEKTGGIRMLWNVSERGELPEFETEILDARPGAIHVPPCDLNGDGHLDFFALISQEHEQVAVFMNQMGSDQKSVPFRLQSLWNGPDLTFGSTGIQLADLDADADIDILYTNGDAFDNSFVNPKHGVQWLENRGKMEFTYHRLTDLVGAYKVLPGDIDRDGDLDMIAVAWLPENLQPKNVYDQPLASIICLEQTSPGEFVRHTLEKDSPVHTTMELADFDGDGDLDFAVGYHSLSKTQVGSAWIDIWWNQPGKRGGSPFLRQAGKDR